MVRQEDKAKIRNVKVIASEECVPWVIGFFYMADVNIFVSELNSAYFSRHLF